MISTIERTIKLLLLKSLGIESRRDLALIKRANLWSLPALMGLFKKSKSQLRQDLFVLSHLKFKRGGFFVEFGATNGVDLSNTYILEKYFGWTGILAEPARCRHSDLFRNRKCSIETACVWHQSGQTLSFNQVEAPELSTLSEYNNSDIHGAARQFGTSYQIPTISLDDLLEKHRAPTVIDYLSIDTEGSEYEILKGFDFSRYKIRFISCEHNFTAKREAIYSLLRGNGYTRIHDDISLFDDWFVLDQPD
jgi:FkbM family methyltransferase